MCGTIRRSQELPIATLISAAASGVVYYRSYNTASEDNFYLISALVMTAVIPYSVKVMFPINNKFLVGEKAEFEGDKEN